MLITLRSYYMTIDITEPYFMRGVSFLDFSLLCRVSCPGQPHRAFWKTFKALKKQLRKSSTSPKSRPTICTSDRPTQTV